jgi:hypothetical protein
MKPKHTDIFRAHNIALNVRIRELREEGNGSSAFLRLIDREAPNFASTNFSHAWSSVASMNRKERMKLKADKRYTQFLEISFSHFARNNGFFYSVDAYCNIVFACAKLGLTASESTPIRRAVERKADFIVNTAEPSDIGNAAWALATMGARVPKFFDAIERKSKYLIKHGTAQSTANTAWGLATLEYTGTVFYECIDIKARKLVENGNVQSISNTAWALGKAGGEPGRFFREVDKQRDWLRRFATEREIDVIKEAMERLNFPSRMFKTGMFADGRHVEEVDEDVEIDEDDDDDLVDDAAAIEPLVEDEPNEETEQQHVENK